MPGCGDAGSKAEAAELQERRNQLAAQIDRVQDLPEPEWDNFKSDLGKSFDAMENDLDDALD